MTTLIMFTLFHFFPQTMMVLGALTLVGAAWYVFDKKIVQPSSKIVADFFIKD